MAITVKMDITQARDIVAVYRDELEPTWYGSGLKAPHRNDYLRRAIIKLALDVVRARADEALEHLTAEAEPQARNEVPHLIGR
jgi:hypothetical protein